MNTLKNIEIQASRILDELPGNLCFHQYEHTRQVVAISGLIGRRSGLTTVDIQLVQIAAWLHDLGFSRRYEDHEEASVEIARELLAAERISATDLDTVLGCIRATRLPQEPGNLLEAVLCDADLAWLAGPDLVRKNLLLRAEWERVLGEVHSNRKWWGQSIQFTREHRYFTHFGRQVLERKKQKNLRGLELRYPGYGTALAEKVMENLSATSRAVLHKPIELGQQILESLNPNPQDPIQGLRSV